MYKTDTETKSHVRQILHIDMDAFYASVEKRDNPQLADQPVIVGGSMRGVVSTCCYQARRYGVHSAMPIYQAKKLCPYGVYIPPDMDKYKRISREIQKIFFSYTPLVEPLSLDEAFLDVTGSQKLFGPALNMAQSIQDDVQEQTELTCSVGVATNKFIAKVASDMEKPHGITHVPPGHEREFLAPLPIDKLWGAGEKTTSMLKSRGFYTIGDLQKAQHVPGDSKVIQDIVRLAMGIDHREVTPEEPPKSIGQEKTFEEDIHPGEELYSQLLAFSEQVGARLRKSGHMGKTITVKLRNAQFQTRSKQKTIPATDQDREIYQYARELLQKMNLSPQEKIRLLGVTASNLISNGPQQLSLDENREREEQLQSTLDEMRNKYGTDAIRRARLIDPQGQK